MQRHCKKIPSVKSKYFFQLVALSALWGASFMLTRIAAPALGPNLAAGLRMVMATAMLSLIMWKLDTPWPLQHWKELLLLGLLAVAGPHVLYARSALDLPAGYGALLTVTSVLFGAFASAWLKEEALTVPKMLGCLLGFAGAALVVRLGPVEPNRTLVLAALTCMAGAGISGISTSNRSCTASSTLVSASDAMKEIANPLVPNRPARLTRCRYVSESLEICAAVAAAGVAAAAAPPAEG